MHTTMTTHTIVPREEWHAARTALLAREKEHTRLGDELALQRQKLPWVTLEKQYTLQTYSTTGRGVEFLMPYYGFLDRAPKGRAEEEAWQLWIRRHDEYGTV
jgi:predicted dithiol-disulfide oxidoreductase (DUF899 family)